MTKTALLVATLAFGAQAFADVTFFENDNYTGRSITTQRLIGNFIERGFNDKASSAVVTNERWEVCEDAGFGGRCFVLRPGNYPSLGAMGLNDRLSSARRVGPRMNVEDDRYAPVPLVDQDFRRRNGERLFQANVTGVRAVVAKTEQRCWIEKEEVQTDERGRPNVGGAIAGAVLGGILGHQIGGGTGKDIATAGGVVGGAAVGANINRGRRTETRDVQRCEPVANARQAADYWDVTYTFRGQEHHAQMTTPPGATITVNRDGEPRI